jgi:hypothetical protein
MDTSDPISVLDYVLTHCYEQRDYIDVRKAFCKDELFPENDEYYLKMVLNKLNQDGYIDFIDLREGGKVGFFLKDRQAGEGMSIRRNLNGTLFLEGKGYAGEISRKNEQLKITREYREREETLAARLAQWTESLAIQTRNLTFWTRLVAIGAIALVLWEIAAYLLEHF